MLACGDGAFVQVSCFSFGPCSSAVLGFELEGFVDVAMRVHLTVPEFCVDPEQEGRGSHKGT